MRDSEELLRLIYGALVGAGIDLDAVDEVLEFSCEQMSDPSRRARHVWQVNFWRAVEQVSGDPDIGVHLCPHLPLFRNSAIEYLFLSCKTFGQACRLALRYDRLISDAFHGEVYIEDGVGVARITGTNGSDSILRHSEVCFVYGVIDFLAHMTQGAFVAERVHLCCDPGLARDDYERTFACPVSFGETSSEIRFDAELFDLESAYHNPEMLAIHREHADREVTNLKSQDTIDRLRSAIMRRLPGSEGVDIELDDIAGDVGDNGRHVRSELAAAGTSFRKLVQSVRFHMACRLLSHSGAATEAIADLLGFSGERAFRRAFKSLSGLTPSEYRKMERLDRHALKDPYELLSRMIEIDS
ncbi:AraC family transcriptional regulator ligand-binding domain-containing protein [Salinisphaera sp. T31B1]|uniref:AraC family transcriptional regulator n=1 Tax=Salinisphaera sp. T31B1 TaxID=727963 RepID=UPI003342D2B2